MLLLLTYTLIHCCGRESGFITFSIVRVSCNLKLRLDIIFFKKTLRIRIFFEQNKMLSAPKFCASELQTKFQAPVRDVFRPASSP